MNITERSSKDEIIDTACEIIDDKDNRINRLQGDRFALMTVLAVTICFAAIF